MRVCFFSQNGYPTADGGISWAAPPHYRCELPAAALADEGGHTTAVVPRLARGADGALAGLGHDGQVLDRADVVVIQGYVDADALAGARRAGQRVIADLTDTPEVPVEHPYFELAESIRPASMAMYLACDAITVSSDYLARYLRAIPGCPAVHVLRNPIALAEWGPPATEANPPLLGWCGSLLERADDCSVLRGWLGEFLERHDLRFLHVGDGPIGGGGRITHPPSFAEVAGINPARVESRPLRPFAHYVADRPWAEIDVQLVPLMDHHYSRGKSCLKGLEAAAQGIAFVASPQEEYRWLGCGLLAGGDLSDQPASAWVDALESLLDPAERRRQADAALIRVGDEDIGRRWTDWEQLYLSLL